MGNVSVNFTNAHERGDYNPALGWKASLQPVKGVQNDEYLARAKAAIPSLREQMVTFCGDNGLSFIEIPSGAYKNEFEAGSLPFKTWIAQYCAKHGLNPNAHVAIVGPCAKDTGSSEIKTSGRELEEVRDYLRGMFVFLEGPNAASAKQSMTRMGNAMSALDSALESGAPSPVIARKNFFYAPKVNGFRCYKSLWRTGLPAPYGGEEMLAEVKIEHASQQDLNRMTRHIMRLDRKVKSSLSQYYTRCVCDREDHRGANSRINHLSQGLQKLNALARMAYDFGHSMSSMNVFLGAKAIADHRPVTAKTIQALAREIPDVFGPEIIGYIQSGLATILKPERRRHGAHFELVS